MSEENFKSGYVALLGAPNAGKSTLLNSLLQQKLSIVSRKPQTTRHKIIGLASTKNYQIVFLDTPGLIEPKYLLHQIMMKSALSAIEDANIVALLVDVKYCEYELSQPEMQKALAKISRLGLKTFILINKIDTINKAEIIPLILKAQSIFPFDEIIPISGLKQINTDNLIELFLKYLPVHPPFFPLDDLSNADDKFFVSEIIREKIFKLYKKEIPYSTAVQIIEFAERDRGKYYINAEIIIERESQKGILLGQKGLMLKKLGEMAREDIEKFLNHKIFLDLFVKVKTDWREKENSLKDFGYM